MKKIAHRQVSATRKIRSWSPHHCQASFAAPGGHEFPTPGFFALALLLAISFAARAQTVITAKDYSGFMRGNGYGWPGFVPVTNLGPLECAVAGTGVVLHWEAAGMLQVASALKGPWADVAGASSPYVVSAWTAQSFYRLRGVAAVHSGVGAGCPQQGFDFTGLPADHWANHPASSNACGWIVPQELTGFANEWIVAPFTADFVRVVLRSFHINPPPGNWSWWLGPDATMEDDALHQNDGWFHFRVRNPDPMGPPREYRLRFELCFDNPYAFSGAPLQLNYWWVERTWDWESHNGHCIYTPIYRIKGAEGVAGPWQHIAETNAHPVAACTNDQRHYRCLFEQTLPRTNWTEIEVAQNLPYTLDDRARFLQYLRTNYLPRYSDLGLRKKHLGYGGLFSLSDGVPSPHAEFNELYAIEVFKKAPGSEAQPELATNRIVIVLAGLDYEPAGNFVAEGFLLEVLDQWNDPVADYRNRASYVVFPIANPDAYEWGTCHVVPYGNGYAGPTNVIHRGYIFLEPDNAVPDSALDPEALALRNYFRALTAQGVDGRGGQIVTLLDFQNDLCPHPQRWEQGGFFPPIYGLVFYRDVAQSNAAVRCLANLRQKSPHLSASRYVRDPVSPQGWEKVPRDVYSIPLWLLFEFDAAALYAETNTAPSWMVGEFASSIPLPGAGSVPAFYVHGYLDQIGQATASDPAGVFKLFGRDIASAVRDELLPR